MATLRNLTGLLAPLLLAACASMQPPEFQYLQQNRYAELRAVMEQKVPDLARGKTADLVYLCFAYSKIRQYDRLFPCIEQLERNIAAGDTQLFWFDFTPTPALLRAVAHIEFGDYPAAIAAAERAVAQSARKDSYLQLRIYALAAAGLAHALAGEPAPARRYATQLHAIEARALEASDKYIGLARIHMALGEYREVLEVLRRDDEENAAFKEFTNLIAGGGSGGASIFAYWEMPKRFMQYRALLELGRAAEARHGYDELLRAAGTAQSADLYWLVLFDRGRIAEREGDAQAAAAFYRRGIAAIEEQRANIHTEGAKIGFVGDKQELYRSLIRLLLAQGMAHEAFEIVERAKARALVDMLAAKQDFAIPVADPARVRQLLANARQAEAAALTAEAQPQAAALRSSALEARRQLGVAAPELASLVSVASLSAAEIQALIPADETLIEYYHDGDAELTAFVVTRHGLEALRLDGRGLADEVRQFRTALEDIASDRHLDLARRLHARLIAPVAGRAAGARLVVVAHGALHYLPFNALHDGQAYLVERHSLRLLPSASVLRYVRRAPPASTGEILAFGNPDLGDPRLDLTHAEAEAVAVTRGRPRSKALLRGAASESALRQYGTGFRYLHFATHGEFNAAAPLKSALRLARDAAGDGLLTVDKLYSLRLDADLVTLSACETGIGKIASGDDVVGLARGFLYAGSRSIVASLWQVDDQATAHLMTRFYGLLGARDKREALRQAQRETMRRYPHPFFWAAFQLTGSAD